MATDNEGKATIGKVNVANHMSLAVEYGISAVPTILFFKGGEVVERIQGFRDKAALQEVLDKLEA